jgi:hypothetical protein
VGTRAIASRTAELGRSASDLVDQPRYTVGWQAMSKKTKKKKAKLRRSKANHGKRPNMGR